MSGADLYGGCPGCGVNIDPAEHDCPEAERAAIARAEQAQGVLCGVLMTEKPGDLSIGLGGGRFCTRPVKEDGLCAVHLGHRKRRATLAKQRRSMEALRRRRPTGGGK